MKRRYKIGLSIVAVALAIAAYVYFFGPQTRCIFWLKVYHDPVMDVAPKRLNLNECSDSAYRLNALNFNFSVPWTDVVQVAVSTSAAGWACSGSNIVVYCYDFGDVTGEIKKDAERNPILFKVFFEAEEGASNYSFFSKIFSLTTKDISLFDSKFTTDIKVMLSSYKLMLIGGAKDRQELYVFKYGNIRGFQCGSPTKDRRVDIYLFDQMDRPYNLLVGARTNASITQNDINTILMTFSTEP